MTWIEAEREWRAEPEDSTIDGESLRDSLFCHLERDPYRDDGGES